MTEPSVKFSSSRSRQRGHQPAPAPRGGPVRAGWGRGAVSGRSGCPEPRATRPQSHKRTLLTHEPRTVRSSHWAWERGLAGIIRQCGEAAEDLCAQLARELVQSPALANSIARHKLFGLSLGFLICKMGNIRALSSQRCHED